MKVYNPLSSITINQLEGLTLWKEISVDSLVHGLFCITTCNKVQRGYCGLGNYHLHSQFASLFRPPDELLLDQVPSPEEIVSTGILVCLLVK